MKKDIIIGFSIGILVALVIIFGYKEFNKENSLSSNTIATSETTPTVSSNNNTTDNSSNTTNKTDESNADTAKTPASSNISEQESAEYYYKENPDLYTYVGENESEKWYINQTSCRIESEDEHSMTIVFEIITLEKNKPNESYSVDCHVRGYDGLKSRRYGDLGTWDNLRTDEKAMKANKIAMRILNITS